MGQNNMKKFNAIIGEVKQTRQKIKEVEEKTKEIRNTYLNIMDIKKGRIFQKMKILYLMSFYLCRTLLTVLRN